MKGKLSRQTDIQGKRVAGGWSCDLEEGVYSITGEQGLGVGGGEGIPWTLCIRVWNSKLAVTEKPTHFNNISWLCFCLPTFLPAAHRLRAPTAG